MTEERYVVSDERLAEIRAMLDEDHPASGFDVFQFAGAVYDLLSERDERPTVPDVGNFAETLMNAAYELAYAGEKSVRDGALLRLEEAIAADHERLTEDRRLAVRLEAALRPFDPVCRTDGCQEPAEFVLWGKLTPPEYLGPRCYDHTVAAVGTGAISTIEQWAILDLRPVRAALAAIPARPE